jgi:phosphate transport system protein
VIENSVKALFISIDNDDEYNKVSQLVFDTDHEIDNYERKIEGLCLHLLLQQQPVAGDLRRISSALKMISDLERIGDQASDITELSEYIRHSTLEHKLHLREMSKVVIEMVRNSIDSYIEKDINKALRVFEMDNEVDSLFDRVKGELVAIIADDDTDAELCIDLLMVAKYLERIGDHAENIAEWAEYSIAGFHRKLQN